MGVALLGVTALVFVLMYVMPGDPVMMMMGQRVEPKILEQIRHNLGLDQPRWKQYLLYLDRLLHGNLGTSYFTRSSVMHEISMVFPKTAELAGGAMLWAIIVGIPAGVICAVKRNSLLDRIIMSIAVVGISTPVFWLGLLAILLFAVQLRWLPPGGYSSAWLSNIYHLILPSLTLGSIVAGFIARMTRASMVEIVGKEYVTVAYSKGLSQLTVITKHVLKNAFIPIITIIGINLGDLLGGAVLTEMVFSWPGLGRSLMQAIQLRDFPMVQGIILFISGLFILTNLLVDLVYALFDPRIKYQ